MNYNLSYKIDFVPFGLPELKHQVAAKEEEEEEEEENQFFSPLFSCCS